MRELGQLAANAEHDEHGAGSWVGPSPRGIRSTARGGRQQLGLGVVQIGRRDDEVGVDLVTRAVGVEIADAPCAIVAHDDVGHPGARDESAHRPLGEVGDAVDHLAEAALRVQHSVVEVEVAHQVVQARRRERRGAEEHRRIAEHLAQAGVAHVAGDEAIEALEQQSAESAEAAEHRAREQRRRRREVVVQEVVERELRGLVGRVEVALERVPGPGFDRLEQGDGGGPLGRHVDRVGMQLEVHAVARIEPDEVELLGRARAEQPVEVLEHLGHEVPRRSGVEPEARGSHRPARPPTVSCASRRSPRARRGEQRCGGEPGDARSDHDDAIHAVISRPRAVAARMSSVSLRVAGTRTRVVSSSLAGVRRSRAARLGEQGVGRGDGATAAAGQLGDDGAGDREVGVDVVEHARLVGLVEAIGVDPREVAATASVEVVGEVAQEVDLLEGRTEVARAALPSRVAMRIGGEPERERAQAHQADDLGRAVDVRAQLAGIEVDRVEVAAHRREERPR